MKHKNGLVFPDADDYLFDRLPDQGVWQDAALQAGLKYCTKFRTAIDGGAHIGTWSIALSDKFESVIAFEPAQDTFDCLSMNTKNKNVTALNAALGASQGSIRMAWTKKDKKRHHTGARFIEEGGQIPRLTIDSLFLDDVDFIKLDLEGGEPDALRGAEHTLQRCRPVLVFEDKGFCERFGYDRDAAINILTDLGAVEFEKHGINRVWGWR